MRVTAATANGVGDGIVITVEYDDTAVQRDDDGVTSVVDVDSVEENTDNSDVFAGAAGEGKEDGRRTPNEGDGMTICGRLAMRRTNGGVNATVGDGRRVLGMHCSIAQVPSVAAGGGRLRVDGER